MLTSERRVVRYASGVLQARFERIPGKRAESPDPTAYAWAARSLVNADMGRRAEELATPAAPRRRPAVIRSAWLGRWLCRLDRIEAEEQELCSLVIRQGPLRHTLSALLVTPNADAVQAPAPLEPYDVDDILLEGCFLEREEIERMIDRLRSRKNLILQGPPGTGKTWIAKRLAFALMGERDEARVRAVQFHPNLSYEDFVRGWRPSGDGTLALADGVFMEAIRAALGRPDARFVVIIEEINRGNPAQIFGEMLTLLEAGKRTPREALELCYPDPDGVRRPVHVPENLFVIGTMNIADRSLALVDLAFRRRFAFIGLEPRLGPAWRRWVTEKCGVDPVLVNDIERRILALNTEIAETFGHQFEIGHSYVTPTSKLEPGTTKDWFRQVAETEIGPLLEEYWFDAPRSAQDALERLLQGW